MLICMLISMYIYIYVCVLCVYIYTYMHIYKYMYCIYICILYITYPLFIGSIPIELYISCLNPNLAG